jgi:hypothetical protein
LPEGSQAILLTEEEYRNTLEGGGNSSPPPETGRKADERGPTTTGATIGNPPSTKNSLRNGKRVEHEGHNIQYRQLTGHINLDVQYCQPTSSKTKVKNLVTNDEEEETL